MATLSVEAHRCRVWISGKVALYVQKRSFPKITIFTIEQLQHFFIQRLQNNCAYVTSVSLLQIRKPHRRNRWIEQGNPYHVSDTLKR